MMTMIMVPQIKSPLISYSTPEKKIKITLLVFQVLAYSIAIITYLEATRRIEAPSFFHETVLVYSIGAAILSATLIGIKSKAAIQSVLITKIVIMVLLTYTTHDSSQLTMLLIIILQMEAALLAKNLTESIILHTFLICCVIGIGLHSNLFGYNVILPIESSVSVLRTLQFSGILILFSFLTNLTAFYAYRSHDLHKMVTQQKTSLDNLSEFNQRLQRWAQTADSQSAERERNRISRELHDISGYMFTNLVALMDAAISTGNRNKTQLTELLNTARKQAQEGLQETRIALRKQREIRSKKDAGLRTIYKITSIFQQVTGTKVELHFGNLPNSFDRDLNHCLYRIVQESLTNAIRHGKATLVKLNFWIRNNTLVINIHDNGVGSKEIIKGLGLTGIEERVNRIAGSMEAGNAPHGGFRLHIEIPTYKNEKEYRVSDAEKIKYRLTESMKVESEICKSEKENYPASTCIPSAKKVLQFIQYQ